MRNLHILQKYTGILELIKENNDAIASACFDEFGHIILIYTIKHQIHAFRYNPETPSINIKHLSSQNLEQVKDDPNGPVNLVSFDYIQELAAAVLAFTNGEIYLYYVESNEIKEGGVLNGNIIAAKWSPNEEYFAVATDEEELILFNPEFDILYQKPIDDDDMTFDKDQQVTEDDRYIQQACITWRGDSSIFQINYHINGGFKSLTRDVQQGLEVIKGPAKADNNFVFSVSEKPLPHLKRPICFMPSGSFVAGFQERPVKKNEFSDDNIKTVNEIIFWEKNGLRHGEFILPVEDNINVIHILFNSNSTLLCLLCITKDKKQMQIIILARSNWEWQIKQKIINIDMEETQGIRAIQWMLNKNEQLFYIDGKGNYTFIDFYFDYTTSMKSFNHKNQKNLSYSCFTTNCTLNITPLSRFLIPPPMSEKKIILKQFPMLIDMFGHFIATLDQNGLLTISDCFQIKQTSPQNQFDLQQLGLIHNASECIKLQLFQINLESKDNFVVVIVKNQLKSQIYDLISFITIESSKVTLIKKIQIQKVYCMTLCSRLRNSGYEQNQNHVQDNIFYLKQKIQSENILEELEEDIGLDSDEDIQEVKIPKIIQQNDSNYIIVQSGDKKLRKIQIDNIEDKPETIFEIPVICQQIQTGLVSGLECVIGMSKNMKLYLNDKLFSNQCTSFQQSQTFLSFTNSTEGLSHELFNYDLNKPLPIPAIDQIKQQNGQHDLPVHPSLTDSNNFNIRAVERGSKIVTVDSGILTVLQMPRGNLEGIYPRIITIKKAIEYIQDTQYGKAFQILRQHKIDLNLIYDVDPALFIKNVSKFVDEVHKADFLNLFINSLCDELRGNELDFMIPLEKEIEIKNQHSEFIIDQIEMKNYEKNKKFNLEAHPNGKINQICESIRKELLTRNENNCYILTILTIYVKKQPQELSLALDKIREMREIEKNSNLTSRVIPPHLNPKTMKPEVLGANEIKLGSKEALEYLSWIVNPNKLFDVALQTYDFELVTLVATQTQKDPKEYVPYLQELRKMDPQYMKFKIQYDLKEYKNALEVISQSGNKYFQEALQLIKKQRLFKEGLQLYKQIPELHSQVLGSFGEYLQERGYHQEAGFLFMNSENKDDQLKGLQAFKKCANKDLCLAMAFKLNYDSQQINQLNLELVEILMNSHKYQEAADILIQTDSYKIEQAVEYYNKGNAFVQALRESMKVGNDPQKRQQLINSTKNSLNLAYDVKKNYILKILQKFDEKYLRLKIVQNTKKSVAKQSDNQIQAGLGFDADQISMSGSSSYQSSQKSSRNDSRSSSNASSLSQTSKKSKRQSDKKERKKLRKKKQVKEGSPFEEDYLIDLLKEEIKLTQEDKSQIKEIINALIFFGQIDTSTQLHELAEKLMRAQNVCETLLLSVEQQAILEEQPDIKEYFFPDELSNLKKNEDFKQSIQDWQNFKFYKH